MFSTHPYHITLAHFSHLYSCWPTGKSRGKVTWPHQHYQHPERTQPCAGHSECQVQSGTRLPKETFCLNGNHLQLFPTRQPWAPGMTELCDVSSVTEELYFQFYSLLVYLNLNNRMGLMVPSGTVQSHDHLYSWKGHFLYSCLAGEVHKGATPSHPCPCPLP